MADIHIGKISKTEEGKGKAQLVYHIPIDTPKAGIIPTPASSLSGLQQMEIDALAAGMLFEVTKDMVIEGSLTQAQIATKVKADWQNVKADYNNRYNFEYKFYGVTESATA